MSRLFVALLILVAGSGPAWCQGGRAPVPPVARLEALIGTYDVEARLYVRPDAEPLVGRGESTFERSHGGAFVHEAFTLSVADRAITGDAWLAWRAGSARYELSQVDDANPATFWLLGQWDADRGRLAFHDLAEARPPGMPALRWEYWLTPDGGFVKEMLRPDEAGRWTLLSDYRYTPKGGAGERPRATSLAGPTRVPMAAGSSHVVIDVSIDGHGPFPMILDTGAATTVLEQDLVQELGLVSLGTTRIGDPSDPLANEVDELELGLVEIGGARFEGVQAVGWRGEPLLRGGATRGVIGLPTFRDCLLTIDYPEREVALGTGALPEADGKRILPLDARGIASLPVDVAGREVLAHLDVGNGSSLILPGAWRHDVALKGEVFRGTGVRASGSVEFTIGTLDGAVTIGEHVFRDPEVRFDPGLQHVNVGYGLLKGFALTLDQRSGRVRLEPGEAAAAPGVADDRPAHAPAEGRRPLGAALAMRSDGVAEIRQVLPGTAAEAAGLLAGDVLFSIDGQPLSDDALMGALAGTAPITLGVRRGDAQLELVLFAD
jgi:hypothetical protein